MIVVFAWCPIAEQAFRLWFILRTGWTEERIARWFRLDICLLMIIWSKCVYIEASVPFRWKGSDRFSFTTFRHHAVPSLFPGFLSAFSPFYQSRSRQNDLRGSYLASLARHGRSRPLGQAWPWPFFLSFSLFFFLYKLIITTKAASFILHICRKIK